MMSKHTVAEVTEAIGKLSPADLKVVAEHCAKMFGLASPFDVQTKIAAAVKPQTGKAVAQETRMEEPLWDLVLVKVGEKKIQTIKAVRSMLGLDLMDAKTIVDQAATEPQALKKGLGQREAEDLKWQFDASGTDSKVAIWVSSTSASAKGGGDKKIVVTGLGGLDYTEMLDAIEEASGRSRNSATDFYLAIDPRNPQTLLEGLSEAEAKEKLNVLLRAGVIAHIE